MFVHRHYTLPTAYIERLTLRADGFVSVNASYTVGEMLTKPFKFSGRELEIDYSTSAPGFVRVEIRKADGTPISGFTLADCPEITSDEIEHIVSWKKGTNVSQLAGKSVHLCFVMKDADLLALRLQ